MTGNWAVPTVDRVITDPDGKDPTMYKTLLAIALITAATVISATPAGAASAKAQSSKVCHASACHCGIRRPLVITNGERKVLTMTPAACVAPYGKKR